MPIIPQPIPFNVGSGGGAAAESCLLWSYTSGTLDNSQNTNTYGWGMGISSGHVGIGKTMTKFSLFLKCNDTGVAQGTFAVGVWASGNNSKTTPTSSFTSPIGITNFNQMTGTLTEYEFEGSHTIALNDVIGIIFPTSLSYVNHIGLANGAGCTGQPANQTFQLWAQSHCSGAGCFANYGTTNNCNSNVYQC